MNTINVSIDGEGFELSPSFLFIKKLRQITGSGNLIETIGKAGSMDVELMAQVMLAAMQSHNVRKYNIDQLGEALMNGDITGTRGDDELKGFEVVIALLSDVISQLTGDKKEESKN